MTNFKSFCPCSSGIFYDDCCRRFHEGDLPENALQLMRSRFSAFAYDKPKYIIETTHPASSQYHNNKFSWERNISKFSKSSTFNKLDILDFKENNLLATVTFTAYMTQNDREVTFTEKSYFEKVNGRWYYLTGQLAQGYAPHLVTHGQLKLLSLAYYGDPILRKQTAFVNEMTPEIKKLVDEMIETMDAYDGIGLAAPQVHHSLKLFIIRVPIETEKDKVEFGAVHVFINPVISLPSKETWITSEGCLSIPTIHIDVERPHEITVDYTNFEGLRINQRFSGLLARMIMHENDHINGVLMIDHLGEEERKKLEPLLQKLENRIHHHPEI